MALNEPARMALIVLLLAAILLIPEYARSVTTDELPRPPLWQLALVPDGSSAFTVNLGLQETPDPWQPGFTMRAYVTGYNTVPEQTDSTPCIARDGSDICGRTDAVACPRDLALGTWVEIGGKRYECVDRTAAKHDGRFDISCDKDMSCPHRITGWYRVRVLD